MKLSENIDGTLARWQVEIQECREAMLDPPKAKPNILDRLVVEMDYLLVEASKRIAQLEAELRYYKALCKYQEEGVTGWRYVYISDETATELEEARKALGGE